MAVTLSGTEIQLTGIETPASVFASAANNPSGDTGVFMNRSNFANNAVIVSGTDLFMYTVKDGYVLTIMSSSTLNHINCILKLDGTGATSVNAMINNGTYNLGNQQIINGKYYPDTTSILICAHGDGDWDTSRNIATGGGSVSNWHGIMYFAGRRMVRDSAACTHDFCARFISLHSGNSQAQWNMSTTSTITGNFLEIIASGITNFANPNVIGWNAYPSNIYFNNVSGLEIGKIGTISGFNFNRTTFQLICVGGVDRVLQDSQRLTADFVINNGGNNNYGEIDWKNNFVGTVVDASFNAIGSPKYHMMDTNNGNRYANGSYPNDITLAGTGAANGQITANLLMAYYGLISADYLAEPTGIRPIDYRHPYELHTYKYGYNISTLQILDGVGTITMSILLPTNSLIVGTKTTVDAYTTLNTAAQVYDRAASYLEDVYNGETSTIVGRSGLQIELAAKNLIINATAASAFVYDGTNITIKSSNFTGGAAATTGTVTTQNGTLLSNGVFDCNVNYQSGAPTTLTNVTVNGTLDFNTAGTYDLVGCTINTVTNSSGGAVIINRDVNSTITTNTGPNITINNPSLTFTFTVQPAVTGYEWRLYSVTAIGSLAGSVELAGEEVATLSTQSYTYAYSVDTPVAVQIISPPGVLDYKESVTYYTLGNSDQNTTITLQEDINN